MHVYVHVSSYVQIQVFTCMWKLSAISRVILQESPTLVLETASLSEKKEDNLF